MTEKSRGPHPQACSDTSDELSYEDGVLRNKYEALMAMVSAPASNQKKISLFRSPNKRQSNARKSVGFPRSIFERALEESPPQPPAEAPIENAAEQHIGEGNNTPNVVVQENDIENATRQKSAPPSPKNKKTLVCSTPMVGTGKSHNKAVTGRLGGRLSMFMELSSIGSGSSKSNGGHVESDDIDRNRDGDNLDENHEEGLAKTRSRIKNQTNKATAKGKSKMNKTSTTVAPLTSKTPNKAAVLSPRKEQNDVSVGHIITISDDQVQDDAENQGPSSDTRKPPAVIARRRNALHCTIREDENLQLMARRLSEKHSRSSKKMLSPRRQAASPKKKRKSLNEIVEKMTEKINKEIQTSLLDVALPNSPAPREPLACSTTTTGNKQSEPETAPIEAMPPTTEAVPGPSSLSCATNERDATNNVSKRHRRVPAAVAGSSMSDKKLRKRSRNWTSKKSVNKKWAELRKDMAVRFTEYMMNQRRRRRHREDNDDQSDKSSANSWSSSKETSYSDILHRHDDSSFMDDNDDGDDYGDSSASTKAGENSRWRMVDSGGGDVGGARDGSSSLRLGGGDDFLLTDPVFLMDTKKTTTSRKNVRKTFVNRKKMATKATVVSTKRRSSIAATAASSIKKRRRSQKIGRKSVRQLAATSSEESSKEGDKERTPQQGGSPEGQPTDVPGPCLFELTDEGQKRLEQFDRSRSPFVAVNTAQSQLSMAASSPLNKSPGKQSKKNATRAIIDLEPGPERTSHEDVEDPPRPSTSREIAASYPAERDPAHKSRALHAENYEDPQPSTSRRILSPRRNLTLQFDSDSDEADQLQEQAKKKRIYDFLEKLPGPVSQKSSKKVTNEESVGHSTSSTGRRMPSPRRNLTSHDADSGETRELQAQPKNKQKAVQKESHSYVLNKTSSQMISTDVDLEPIRETPANTVSTEEASASTARNSHKDKRKNQQEKSDLAGNSRNDSAKKQVPPKKQKINVDKSSERVGNVQENSKKGTTKTKKPVAPKAKKATKKVTNRRAVSPQKPTAQVIEDNHEEDTGVRRSTRERKPPQGNPFEGQFIVKSATELNRFNKLRQIFKSAPSHNTSKKTSMLKRTIRALSPIMENEVVSPPKVRIISSTMLSPAKTTGTTDNSSAKARNARIVQNSDVSGIEAIDCSSGPSCVVAPRVTRNKTKDGQFSKVPTRSRVATTSQKSTGHDKNKKERMLDNSNVSSSSSTRIIDKKVLSVNLDDRTYSIQWLCDGSKITELMKSRDPISGLRTTENQLDGSFSGLIKIAPNVEKPKQSSDEYSVNYRVISGKALVQLDALNENRNATVVKLEDFTIPTGATYYIRNLNKTVPLLLSFTKYGPSQPFDSSSFL